jgi:aminoglycoside 6'-N-acetyltransferase
MTAASQPAASIALREAQAADRFLVNRWLAEPHVAAWFGSRAVAEAEIALARQSPTALCRIVMAGAEAIGYAQAVDRAAAGAVPDPGIPSGSYEADVFIGVANYRGQGHGGTALALLATEVFATTLTPCLVITVPLRNEPAVRLVERAGFRWLRVAADPLLGPCWLMRRER